MHGVVLTNHNILNMISNYLHLIIIVLVETNTKGNVTLNTAIFWQDQIDCSMVALANRYCYSALAYFLPARRYASSGLCESNVSVCPSLCYTPVLCKNEESQRHDFFTIW